MSSEVIRSEDRSLRRRQPIKLVLMDEHSKRDRSEPLTVAEVIDSVEPMGDLRRFAIEDLTVDEEAKFFGILEDA